MTQIEDRVRSGLQAEALVRAGRTAESTTSDGPRLSLSGAGVAVAMAVVVLVIFGGVSLLSGGGGNSGPEPASRPDGPFHGNWVTTDIRFFEDTATMVVGASVDESVEMIAHNFFNLCVGAPSTMIGTGRFEGDNVLVIPAPVFTCDDGSQPETLNSPSLEEELQNLTFTRDPGTDILTDNFGSVWVREGAYPSRDATTPPSEAELTELLNGFLEARVAGEGAQQQLNIPEEDIPLLYATTSGDPYEQAEFEQVLGYEWPYGFMAFKVRLFAGDTVVEQLFFTPLDGRLGLEYQVDGFGTDIAPTTENGKPVAAPFSFSNGQVTLQVVHPWVSHRGGGSIWLVPEGPGVQPTTDGGERNDWDGLRLIADPALVGPDCRIGPESTDAAALVESIRSAPGLEATPPVTVRVGEAKALMMDATIAAGASLCEGGVLSLLVDPNAPAVCPMTDNIVCTSAATGEWMRLYLFDVPEGSSMRILVIGIVAPESRFEKLVEVAAPVVDSVEFHAP